MTERSPISGISSMATRDLLRDLCKTYAQQTDHVVRIESVGGVNAAERVRAGEAFDVVVLAADAIERLAAERLVDADTRVDLALSEVAVAVPAGAQRPCVDTEKALRAAVLEARAIGYSTGPSGVQLMRLFERWGIADRVRARLVQAPPGVSVGTLLAQDAVSLGFQQLSELLHVDRIDIIGVLPPPVQIVTVFSAVLSAKTHHPAAAAFIAYLRSPAADALKAKHGMKAA